MSWPSGGSRLVLGELVLQPGYRAVVRVRQELLDLHDVLRHLVDRRLDLVQRLRFSIIASRPVSSSIDLALEPLQLAAHPPEAFDERAGALVD